MPAIRCLISAGPTREYFDPVRYLSNPSSGKMGYALAAAARDAGWQVDLVTGPVALPCPIGITRHPVVTGAEMFTQINHRFNQCDILIMSAAVMDYRPQTHAKHKLKKTGKPLVVTLEPVIDILKTVAAGKRHQCVVGFAAETEHLYEEAHRKCREKNCDYIVANQVGGADSAFESDRNQVSLIRADGLVKAFGPDAKTVIAQALICHLTQNLALPLG